MLKQLHSIRHWRRAVVICLLAIPAAAADLPEIVLFPQGTPEPVVPATVPERVETGG